MPTFSSRSLTWAGIVIHWNIAISIPGSSRIPASDMRPACAYLCLRFSPLPRPNSRLPDYPHAAGWPACRLFLCGIAICRAVCVAAGRRVVNAGEGRIESSPDSQSYRRWPCLLRHDGDGESLFRLRCVLPSFSCLVLSRRAGFPAGWPCAGRPDYSHHAVSRVHERHGIRSGQLYRVASGCALRHL
jgi:hypothetical protein